VKKKKKKKSEEPGGSISLQLPMLRAIILPTLLIGVLSHQTHSLGLVDPIFTAFDETGGLDLSQVEAYSQYTHSEGTDTIILGGSTGEWPSMSSHERLDVLRAWRDGLAKQAPRAQPLRARPRLVFHAGDVNIQRAQALARAAARTGADAILVVAPCIMKPGTLSLLLRVFGSICGQSKLPCFYYHYPGLYNVDFNMTLFAEQALQSIPNFGGIKYIDGQLTPMNDLASLAELARNRHFEVFTSLSANLTYHLENDLFGVIGYTPQAKFVAQFSEAMRRGDHHAAAAAQAAVDGLETSFKAAGDGKMAARYSTRLLHDGLTLGPPRLPLAGLDSAQLEAMREALVSHGFIANRTA